MIDLSFRCNYNVSKQIGQDNVSVSFSLALENGIVKIGYFVPSEVAVNKGKNNTEVEIPLSGLELDKIDDIFGRIVDHYRNEPPRKMEQGCQNWSLFGLSGVHGKISKYGDSKVRTEADLIVGCVRENHSDEFKKLDEQLDSLFVKEEKPFKLKLEDNYHRFSVSRDEDDFYSLYAVIKPDFSVEGEREVRVDINPKDEEMVSNPCSQIIKLIKDCPLPDEYGKPSMNYRAGSELVLCLADSEMLGIWESMIGNISAYYPEINGFWSTVRKIKASDESKKEDEQEAKKRLATAMKQLREQRPEFFDEEGNLSLKGVEALFSAKPTDDVPKVEKK